MPMMLLRTVAPSYNMDEKAKLVNTTAMKMDSTRRENEDLNIYWEARRQEGPRERRRWANSEADRHVMPWISPVFASICINLTRVAQMRIILGANLPTKNLRYPTFATVGGIALYCI
jgi:hypothetical protein